MPPHKLKILIFGGNGLLVSAIRSCIATDYAVHSLSHAECDITDAAAVAQPIQLFKPDIAINGAAYNDVDGAEQSPYAAHALNAHAPGVLARACAAGGALLVHFSTDFVFDGKKTTPYTEDDAPRPLGVYGVSKLAGEQAVLASAGKHLVLRVSWLYGAGGRNFFSQVPQWLQLDRELRVVDDQISVPNRVEDLAAGVAALLALAQANGMDWLRARAGLYHFVANAQQHAVSRYTYALRASEALGSLSIARLLPVPSSAFPAPAARPAYSAMDSGKFEAVFGLKIPRA
jgi:dTDP-4-dehydrorhamnose reductase